MQSIVAVVSSVSAVVVADGMLELAATALRRGMSGRDSPAGATGRG